MVCLKHRNLFFLHHNRVKKEFELSFGIAERISEVLKSKNLTQKDFANKMHKRESEIFSTLLFSIHKRDVYQVLTAY